jgi:enamine deaminase RidA (YjgF/YER057c/UK114 family)
MDLAFVNPPGVHAPAGQYSHLARIDLPGGGTLLFVSGQVALDEQGKIVGKGDVAEQADQVYVNLKRVLASQGATFRDIVKTTVFVTEMAYRGQICDVRARQLGDAAPPSTFVEVSALAHDDLLIEVECVAVIR